MPDNCRKSREDVLAGIVCSARRQFIKVLQHGCLYHYGYIAVFGCGFGKIPELWNVSEFFDYCCFHNMICFVQK